MAKNSIRYKVKWPEGRTAGDYGADDFSNLVALWLRNKAFGDDVGLITSWPSYHKVLERLKNELQQQFRRNLKNVRPVSSHTILRRRAFENLGQAGGHVPSSKRAPYRVDIMSRIISNFKVETQSASETKVKIRLKVEPSGHNIGQFEGLRTAYEGPDIVGISITGLNVTDHKITTDDDRKMIIPMPDGARDRADAILTKSGEFVMNSKKNQDGYQSASGLPVLFRDKLSRSVNRRHYNPVDKERIVFWGVHNGKPIVTNNVKRTLRRRFFGKS